MSVVFGHHQGAVGPDRHHGQLAVLSHPRDSVVQGTDLVQRPELVVVGEQEVHLVADEGQEVVPVTVDAEGIGQRQRDLPSCRVGDAGRLPVRRLGLGPVVEVALHVDDLAGRGDIGADVVRPEQRGHAEEGVHRPLCVRRDDDQAAPGGHVGPRPRVGEGDTLGPQVVVERLAEAVRGHLADVGRPPAEGRHTAHGVGGGTSRHLDGRLQRGMEGKGALSLDQGHRALHERLRLDEVLAVMGDHVDQGIADADDVVAGRRGSSPRVERWHGARG